MNDNPKLYFDCTSTIRSGLNTGVQRVVRGLLAQKEVFERELAVEFVPICHQFDWFYHLDDALRMAEEGRADPASPKISFGYRDIYLCADAFWSMGMTDWLPFIHGRGTTIVNVVYDLIPLTHPEFFAEADTEGFRVALDHVIKYADLLPCISRSTRADLLHYAKTTLHAESVPRTGVFTLAPGLRPGLAEGERVNGETNVPGEYMLAVGTLESRKGLMRLLDEFESVWRQGDEVALVLVGKRGAGSDAIVARIDVLLAEGRPLFWRSNVSDAELKVLYEGASAVVCPSHAEGYGLPLAEALAYGRPVYANRLPVFGEFAGSYPVYFDIDQPGALADLVSSRAGHHSAAKFQPEFSTWADSAMALSALIRDVAPLYKLGLPPFKQRTSLEAVSWAYRMILGHELADVGVAQRWVEQCPSIPELVKALHCELRNAENPLSAEAIRWIYRVILNREVDSDETVEFWQRRSPTVAALTKEFLGELRNAENPLSAEAIRWIFRVILNQEVDSDEAVKFWQERCRSIFDMKRELNGAVMNSDSPLTPEAINLAYQVILGRAVDDEALNYWTGLGANFGQLRDHLIWQAAR